MSQIKMLHIKSHFDRVFKEWIDISDLKKNEIEIQKNFYSRALAAYALVINAGLSEEDSALTVVDGFNDNGIDALYYDRQGKNLWLVQSKFIDKGTGGVENGDILKFKEGIKNLIDGDFSKFNNKVKEKEEDVLESLKDASVRIQIIFAYTGDKLSPGNLDAVNALLEEQNGSDEIMFFSDFNLEKIHRGLKTGISSAPINEDILISDWGQIEHPFRSYYGQVAGIDLAFLWDKYGKRLFTENIRNFLGTSPVNEEIIKTIKSEPENFIYFNNGVTILCDSIKKTLKGGSGKETGTFTCNGISVVNGAQTLGSIGSLYSLNSDELGYVKVLVKFISLQESPIGFGQRITVATNTQNKVEKKDFVSLDEEQARIQVDLKLDGIEYHFKRSDERIIKNENNFVLEEVAFSLASLFPDVDYSTIVKKESGRLWDDVTKSPYTDLFNSQISASKIIKIVKIYRFISDRMSEMAEQAEGRERSIYRYGNSFIAHIIFQKMPRAILADSSINFEDFYSTDLPHLVDRYIDKLYRTIESEYPDSMVVYILRNYTKCRDLKELIL